MLTKKILSCLAVLAFIFPVVCNATLTNSPRYQHPFYMGVAGGYGKTTWGQLVPSKPSDTLELSTPVNVTEGGAVWGVYAGYEIIPQFAFEASYTRYPNATVTFSPTSFFAFSHDGRTVFVSRTEDVELVAKLMLLVPYTCNFRAYSTFGAAGVHRDDVIANQWRLSPSFGVGFNYLLNEHFMVEIGTEYIAGYGQSEIEPDQHYVPFLYSGFMRLAVRV